MSLASFIAAQLRRPSGWFGSHVIGRGFVVGNRRLVRRAIASLGLEDARRVLEIGFGPGDSLPAMASASSSLWIAGADFSAEMVEHATRRVRRAGLQQRVALCLADAARLPFCAGVFDRVLTVNTIYFWPDLLATLSEIRRVLKPGGRAVLAFRPRSALVRSPFTRHGFTLYESGEVVEALRAGGFQPDTADTDRHHVVVAATVPV